MDAGGEERKQLKGEDQGGGKKPQPRGVRPHVCVWGKKKYAAARVE